MKRCEFSQNFTIDYGILLRFHFTSIYLFNFWFCFQFFKSLPQNFCPFEMDQNFEILDLAMAKVEKVNSAYTYCV
jgi:hypothetical protein